VTDFDIRLGGKLDASRIADTFQQDLRTQVRKILPKDLAVNFHRILANETPWQYTYFDGRKNNIVPLESFNSMAVEERQSIADAVNQAAQQGFAYSYNSFNFHQRIRQHEEVGPEFSEIDDFLNSSPFLEFARRLTGDAEITGTDASASWYGPGHFLNIHDDKRTGYDLRAAFVLNFSPLWRTDWGGELKFFSNRRGAKLETAFFPAFNVMNIFSVPQYHAVGTVAAFAGAPRLSISGWLYAGADPY
jgi:Rps23 Pro-64 3,4-dihydroxylase Tpa1-like proline 4-hydroxylase